MQPAFELRDLAWVLLCAGLVMLMQAGFCCLESGLARAKNRINVAIKNLFDFCISSAVFWVFGFALMFGASWHGLVGTSGFVPEETAGPWLLTFFLFQLVFCGTATTIISGAVAERVRFVGYMVISLLVSALFYPIFGHWAWGGAAEGAMTGWLAKLGFVDFAGSTVVHSVGGWISLAAVLVIGPRLGRFDADKPVMHGSDLPLATLGVFLLWFGWFGFNGGSTLAVTDRIPLILVNTNLAAAVGGAAALAVSYLVLRRPDVTLVMNGVLGGLVGITASCHLVAPAWAVVIGIVAGVISVAGCWLLERLKIDDVVGAVPVHGMCGAWGTLAVALFVDPVHWSHGGGRMTQLGIQALGVGVCFLWAFAGGYLALRLLNLVMPLRVSPQAEREGLNFAEHQAKNEMLDLLTEMEVQRRNSDFSHHVTVEPHTDVGQIAGQYNRVLDKVYAEITSREQAVEALRQAEEKYRGIFLNAVEGIFRTSLDGQYLDANPALARIYGYHSPDELRRGVRDIQHQLYVDAARRAEFQRLMIADGMVRGFESQVYRRDRSVIWISENAYVVRDPQGHALCYEGTVVDITDRVQSDSLRREKEAAEAASQAKSQFLANMSHEIRTPLNGVIGMLDLLSATPLSAQQLRYADIAKSSADSLLSLINQILDFSKIEAGKLELEEIEFDPRMVVEDAVEMFVGRAQTKQLELACRIGPEVPSSLLGDPDRFRQIVINLVNNAIKFTERGEVVVRLSVERQWHDRAVVRLAVSDTGIGIPEDRRCRLFQSFSQVDVSTTRRYGGTGLGLAITKTLVELMDGTLDVESQLGSGSTFWCTLQFGKHAERRDPCRIPHELRQLRYLALDDNATNLEILREQFASWGLDLTTVSDGPTALEALRGAASTKRPFGLAILDVQMPDMDGFEVAEAIKKDPATRDTLLIVLTSMGQELSDEDRARLGLAAYVHKPVRQSRLLDAIVSATSRAILAEQRPEQTGSSRANTTANPRGRILVAEDNEVNQIVAGEILTQAGYEFEIVGNGRAAAELALTGDFDLVLMDCQMPELDGFEAARLIRHAESERTAQGTLGRVPIIALTANAIKGDRERCLAAGMDGYLTKPVDPDALVAQIDELVHGAERSIEQPLTASVGHQSATPAASAPPSAVFQVDELRRRAFGDVDLVKRLFDKFQVRAVEITEAMDRSVAGGNAETLAREAHLLRGMSANLAATDVAAIATELEDLAQAGALEAAAVQLVRLHAAVAVARDEMPRVLAEITVGVDESSIAFSGGKVSCK